MKHHLVPTRLTRLVAHTALGLVAASLSLSPVFAIDIANGSDPKAAAASGCGAGLPAMTGQIAFPPVALTKSAAILGGSLSALDAIRAQQRATSLVTLPQVALVSSASPGAISFGANDASLAPATACTGFIGGTVGALPASPLSGSVRPALGTGDFLASQRVRIRHTHYDAEWSRVRAESISPGTLNRLVGTLPQDRMSSLAAVNGWVNHKIAYTEDAKLFGKSDYWAGARRTLRLGKGDCEDIALVKMQMLAAAGISRDDMYLTVTRDLVRNQDHMVLIVKTDAGWRLLDDSTDAVLDATGRNDYRAIVSLGNRESWLHGS